MNIKMIVTDLDGTLLRTNKTISDYTEKILRQCKATGIKLIYATGRGSRAKKLFPADLFDGRAIVNGATASINEQLIYCKLIPHELARSLLMAWDKYGLNVAAERGETHYSNFPTLDDWSAIGNVEVVDLSKHCIDAEKIYAMTTAPEDIAFIKETLPPNLYLSISRDGVAMVMNVDASKSKAVASLADFWGIKQSEIVAFGDDANDLDLLEYCGIGVAMADALSEIKAAADQICGGNDEDGVAKWIESNIFKNHTSNCV